eukprot:5217669-Pyramimonas_sp.AAC.1
MGTWWGQWDSGGDSGCGDCGEDGGGTMDRGTEGTEVGTAGQLQGQWDGGDSGTVVGAVRKLERVGPWWEQWWG